MRIPVLAALLAFVATLFRSQTSLRLENLALQHQLAVYKQAVRRPRLRPSDRLLWAWLSRLCAYITYYHHYRPHLSLVMDCPDPRAIQPPERGTVIAVPEVGGLHYHYERQAA